MLNYICAVAVLTSAQASAPQETAPQAIEAPSLNTPSLNTPSLSTSSPAANILPAGTAIDLVFVDPVDSKANKVGDIIAMKVADDVMVGSAIIIPAGTPVSAEVIHAAKARAMGKAGELIVSARFIQMGDRQIPMKGFKFGSSGTGKSKLTESAVAGFFLTPLPLFIAGGEKHADPGTRAFAKLKDDFDYSAIIASQQVSAPEITPAQNTEGK